MTITTRHRSSLGGVMPVTFCIWDIPPNTEVFTESRPDLLTTQVIDDNPHPGYRKRVESGEIFMSDVNIVHTSYSGNSDDLLTLVGPEYWGRREFRGNLSAWHMSEPSEPAHLSFDVFQAQGNVVNRAFAKAYDDGGAVLGVSFGEGRESLAMLKGPFGDAHRLLDRMLAKKLRLIKAGVPVAKAVLSAWLEYRLGWKPLMYDIKAIMQATASYLLVDLPPVRVVARSSWKNSTTSSRERSLTSQYFHSGSALDTASWDYKVSAGVLYYVKTLSDDGILSEKFRHNYGLQLRNIGLTGWELVPLSFVVDRFLDVSSWLGAIQPNPDVVICGGWRNTRLSYEYKTNIANLFVNVDGFPSNSGPSSVFTKTVDSSERSCSVAPSIIPMLNPGSLSLQQYADHVALILTRLAGFKK